MHIEIILKNYRCFSDSRPARVTLRKGITGFVGVNNAGKSSLLKFFYEFRALFGILMDYGNFLTLLGKKTLSFSFPSTVLDPDEVFCNDNQRELEITLRFLEATSIREESLLPKLEELIINIPRSSNTFTIGLRLSNGLLDYFSPSHINGTLLTNGSTPVTDLSNMFEACRCLTRSLYFPPFRNAVNLGANVNYFDVSVGQAFILDWNQLKAGTSKQQNEAADRLSDDIRRIFGFKRLEIN